MKLFRAPPRRRAEAVSLPSSPPHKEANKYAEPVAFSVDGSAMLAGVSFLTGYMLKSHKQAISEIKSAQQRVRKATEERDKLKEKLKKAQMRLASEKDRLRKSQDKLES
jgi:septal ring factor EnvC (AmiA/AmiB activator)